MAHKTLSVFLLIVSSLVLVAATPHQQSAPAIVILDKNGAAISQLTDGDAIKLQFRSASPADQATPIPFTTSPDNLTVAECTLAKGSTTCLTDSFASLGWYWSKNKQPQTQRTIRASSASAEIQVAPRPVVMVHGFGSDASAWTTYLGASGYLASMGVRGFAVGDAQVPGKLNLGSLANPTGKTGTIQTNAETLRDYIAAVKQTTGAQMIDLVAHSMGNLVSRYYIDRVMPGRDVAQLIMLGPPNQGTACAYLPSAIGYYLPAALEIRPSYVRNVFNQQITHRHGVPFSVIAGTPIVDAIKSPCTNVPSDLAIAFDSASGIQAPVRQTQVWHSDLNVSAQVFTEFVRPLLQKTIGEFPSEVDPAPPARASDDLQFTQVFTGHIDQGTSATHTINIDNVAVASFALFDSTRTLTTTVRGATGNVIQLDPTRNGLVVVQDPATLVYLGYGFNNPRPGPWQVTLQTTDATPNSGADYAIIAQVKGGAVLRAQVDTLLPKVNESIRITAQIELAGQVVPIRRALARVRAPNGESKTIALAAAGSEWKADWQPETPGLFGVDLEVNGNAPDGTLIERSAFFAIEAQPTAEQIQISQLIFLGALSLGVIVILIVVIRRRKARGR